MTTDMAAEEARLFDVSQMTHTLTLAERFTLPPFTVLNTRDGWWHDRKGLWLSTGIESEEGRGRETGAFYTDDESYVAQQIHGIGEQSIFDPVLCELAYRWFCPPGGHVLDPFAGGSVRGVVASWLGDDYTGIDLSEAQVQANQAQLPAIERPAGAPTPVWLHGDSADLEALGVGEVDMVFSCPPYFDLEQYTDHPSDLSNMGWQEFRAAYRQCIRKATAQLVPNRFAVWVIGEVRDGKGMYRNLVGETTEAFEAAGCHYYNEAIIVNAVGTARLRVTNSFPVTRKLCRVHQSMLVFIKGDPKRATQAIEEG